MAFPEILNKSPDENVTGIDGYTLISFDAYDSGSNIDPSTFAVYVAGNLAFSGPDTFHAPFNGPLSSITEIEINNTDGYNIVLDYTGEYISNTLYSVRAYVEDFTSLSIDDTWYFRTGNRIISVVPSLYEIVLDVTFEQPFAISPATSEPANYVFTNGMYARKAEIISTSVVRLWVELFHTEREFSLSVSGVVDGYGNTIPSGYNSITFSPFDFLADLSNFNGRVRSWRDSHVVTADANSVYLGGTKGIDVFHKRSGRWAQIFNEEKQIQSIFIANFGGSYDFSETNAPYLFNVSPAPGSEAPYNSSILFSVGDSQLAVEPTALTIYVNDVLAFNGAYGGWQNSFSGNIDIQYRYLNVVLKPPVPYAAKEEVNVRVVASDLIGNELDTTYTYSVTDTPITAVGWGYAMWGRTNFGLGTS